MLIGPNAPLAIEPGLRSTHMEDVWDFYKPTMVSEYPRVDGHLSNMCYFRSIDNCYGRYASKFEQKFGQPWLLKNADYAVFHAPYNKLVQKSFGRYLYIDHLRHPTQTPHLAELAKFSKFSAEETYASKALQDVLRDLSKADYDRMVAPTELITSACPCCA
jgi:hydroxymethylglutaryl-CoA synthase